MKKKFLEIRLMAGAVVLISMVSSVFAQSTGSEFRRAYPDLADLFSAFDYSQAAVFEAMIEIGNSPATQDARDAFEQQLRMQQRMSMSEMMSMMAMHMNMDMSNSGPYFEYESPVQVEIISTLEQNHSIAETMTAFENAGLPERAIAVIQKGNEFESQIYNIYANEQIVDKSQALSAAVLDYLSVGNLSVPSRAKPSDDLHAHPYANAFADAYPVFSGLLWSTQWLELATIEAMILESQDAIYSGSVDLVEERFWGKLKNTSDSRLERPTIFPTPVELPMAPVIAPRLYTASPEAAVIIDNLNMMETVIADILAYPSIQDRRSLIIAVVDEFTNDSDRFDDNVDYLISALRGGIFNQGGPAIGSMMQSERNKSRMQMGMQHSMIMSGG